MENKLNCIFLIKSFYFDSFRSRKFYLLLCFYFLINIQTNGQYSSLAEKKIKGWDISILPSFVYNTDKGLQYGGLANIFYYADSLQYPEYWFNLYLQISHSTKGNFVNYIFFDSKHLFPKGIRMILDIGLIKNNFQQFYGFNGYDALYNKQYEEISSQQFISRSYYNIRKIAKTITTDFHGNMPISNFLWDLGFGYFNISVFPNKEKMPNGTNSLFNKYVNYGVIPVSQKNGGTTSYFKCGLIFDTRNDEAVSSKGVWTEGILLYAPSFINKNSHYSQIAFIHRQYFTLVPNLIFAFRLAYQTKISGDMPFYMMPYLLSTYQTKEALGGVKTIRGILNERLQGNGFFLGNAEIRCIAIKSSIFGRNLAIAFNLFTDAGLITNKYNISKSLDSKEIDYKFNNEKMHYSIGNGVRFILNHNFIVSFDYGRALNKNDGIYGFYLDLDYLY
jgi:hypothetical protein